MRKYFGYLAIILGAIIFLVVLYLNSQAANRSVTFSAYTLMTSSWENYKKQFINGDGRVIDSSQNSLTTSEGQSYAMLRAVWVDDKDTFDLVRKWTGENLRRPNDQLFGWRWGQKNGSAYGFLDNGGDNSASDADSDIALALILASRRWHQESYLNDAKPILNDLWKNETAQVNGKNYLIAGNWANSQGNIVINPSYFTPYAWRIFAEVDQNHDWLSLIGPAYDLLGASSREPLDKNQAAGLPPDWLTIDKKSGSLQATNVDNLTTNYAFDAMRVPWRVALDYQWNKEPRALDYLAHSFQKLNQDWQDKNQLAASYSHDGQTLNQTETPEMYATALGYFMVTQPDAAKKIFEEKILKLYSNDTNSFRSELPYYAQNWLWFGAGLYNNFLIPFKK